MVVLLAVFVAAGLVWLLRRQGQRGTSLRADPVSPGPPPRSFEGKPIPDAQLAAGRIVAGLAAAQIIFHLIYDLYPHGWVLGAPVIAPAVASTIMITPGQAFPHAPPQWTGLIVMTAYALALSITAIAVTSRRDIT